jgi:HSP20 family protein
METKPVKRATRKMRPLSPYWNTPFDRLFRDDLPDLWDGAEISTIPSVNFREEKDKYTVDMAVPGLRKEDFDIRVEGNLLTVSCDKESEHKEDTGEGYSRKEYSYSSFSRSVTLPEHADSKKITAKYSEGILQLSIPKKEGAMTENSQKIKVQ